MGNMPIFPDALVNAVMGYGVVFVGLILLLVVVVIMGKMPIFPDAIVNAIMGYGVVFVGLIMLLAVVVIMGKVMTARKAAPAAAAQTPASQVPASQVPAKSGPEAPGSAGKIALHNVSDKDAALIMAIVADKLGKPINQLRFKSIKEVK